MGLIYKAGNILKPIAASSSHKLEIHACSNRTKSMQLYFRNYMKSLYRLLS